MHAALAEGPLDSVVLEAVSDRARTACGRRTSSTRRTMAPRTRPLRTPRRASARWRQRHGASPRVASPAAGSPAAARSASRVRERRARRRLSASGGAWRTRCAPLNQSRRLGPTQAIPYPDPTLLLPPARARGACPQPHTRSAARAPPAAPPAPQHPSLTGLGRGDQAPQPTCHVARQSAVCMRSRCCTGMLHRAGWRRSEGAPGLCM